MAPLIATASEQEEQPEPEEEQEVILLVGEAVIVDEVVTDTTDATMVAIKRGDIPHRRPFMSKKEENSRSWFRFEMLRMSCVIFIATMSIFLREDTMPTRPLPSHFTQIGTMHHTRINTTFRRSNNLTTLLSVPFYVYETLIWDNMTFQGHNLTLLLAQKPLKQSEDYWFQKAAQQHPMRTYDPSLAQLFVVPTLMNFASDGVALTRKANMGPSRLTEAQKHPRQSGACHGALCNEQLIEQAEMVLANSPHYHRSNGSDHIMVLSNWYSGHHRQILDSPIFANLNLIQFEDRNLFAQHANNRTNFPSTYVGNPCPTLPVEENNNNNNKTSDFVLVANLWKGALRTKRRRFQARRDICHWLSKSSRSSSSNYSTSVCGTGDQCPALAQSRYGFHVRGDTFGSSRLMDTLLSGTVPIFTDEQQYTVLPSWIDWKLLSVQVNVSSQPVFEQGLRDILMTNNNNNNNNSNNTTASNNNELCYEEKHNHVISNRDLLDWRTGILFDVYMFMFQRKLLPDSVDTANSGQPSSPYDFSALLI